MSDFVKIVKFLPGEPKSIEAQVMRGEIADSVALVAWRRMKVNKESVLRNHQMSSKSIEDIYESCWNKMKPATLKFQHPILSFVVSFTTVSVHQTTAKQIKLLQNRMA